MLLRNSHQRWFAAAVCVIATAGYAVAQEGVVKLSASPNRPGVVRLSSAQASAETEAQPQKRITAPAYFAPNAGYAAAYRNPHLPLTMQGYYHQQQAYAQQAGFAQPAGFAQQAGFAQPMPVSGYGMPSQMMHTGPADYDSMGVVGMNSSVRPTSFSQSLYSTGGCGFDGCGTDGCGCGVACGCGSDSVCGEGCDGDCCSDRTGRRGRRRGRGQCDSCEGYCYGPGHRDRMVTLFARATPDDGCTRWGTRWWRGQQYNYLARNQRLSNTLFGWLVPSGCCGQGCPPVGKYHMVYADDPGYADPRDGGQLYGAQGYGTHLTVPLAPNVRHSYNYSWGTPSSRITPMGHYNPAGGYAQQAPCQTW